MCFLSSFDVCVGVGVSVGVGGHVGMCECACMCYYRLKAHLSHLSLFHPEFPLITPTSEGEGLLPPSRL